MTPSYQPTPPLRSRLTAWALSVGLVALLIALLLRLGVLPSAPKPKEPASFALLPEGKKVAATTTRRRAHAAARPTRQPPPAARPVPPVVPPTVSAPALAMSRDEFAGTDIGKLGKAPGTDEGDDTGTDTAAVYGPGEGPGGARLYKAEWYREPPPSALALYLPGGPQPGWATIACRTAPAWHVENCRELDEAPRGSGLARALRQAAWQFQVRPPRLGGKPLMGAWVRIRFDFTENRPG